MTFMDIFANITILQKRVETELRRIKLKEIKLYRFFRGFVFAHI
jgi:hypothetical protein